VLSVDGGDFATLIRGENISPLGPTDGGGSGPVRFFLLGVADWPRGGRSQPCLPCLVMRCVAQCVLELD
jgi:hypothetical protein